MGRDRKKTPLRELRTYGESRAVRWDRCDYRGDEVIHLTLCAYEGDPFKESPLADLVCRSVEFYSTKLDYRLFGCCLMPDHLHIVLSPNSTGTRVNEWLQQFKSYTTNRYMKQTHRPHLWQRSGHDHICRDGETAETVLRYIAENPVRAGLVRNWREWPWTRVFIEI